MYTTVNTSYDELCIYSDKQCDIYKNSLESVVIYGLADYNDLFLFSTDVRDNDDLSNINTCMFFVPVTQPRVCLSSAIGLCSE